MIKRNEGVQREEHTGIVLIYVGRLIRVKGIDILLEAFARLQRDRQDITLQLLGDGDYRKECEEIAGRLQIKPFVTFEGFPLDKDIYMKKVDIFVYPSRWQEAFGISIVEAMSYGLLCVASRTGGIPEVIEDGENGILFEKENSDDLYNMLKQAVQLIEDQNSDRIRKNAIATAEHFAIEKTSTVITALNSKISIRGKYFKI